MIDWPLDSNVIRRGSLNNTFGLVRRNADGSKRPHQGWDFYAAPGTPVHAIANGTIRLIRTVGDYGNTIVQEFKHDGDTWFFAYSHLSRIDITQGQRVNIGDVIGLSGNTGNAASMRGDDCHLHVELRTVPAPGLGLTGRYTPMAIFGPPPMTDPVKRRLAE